MEKTILLCYPVNKEVGLGLFVENGACFCHAVSIPESTLFDFSFFLP